MKKVKSFILCIFCALFTVGCTNNGVVQIANPWVDCERDYNYAKQTAGFEFPLKLDNYKIRAMKDMIEVIYKIDNDRTVVIRKSTISNDGDISGVYNTYPINKETKLSNGVVFNTRGDENKIYVANMSASSGHYSIYCEKGLTLEELEKLYKVLAEAETEKG